MVRRLIQGLCLGSLLATAGAEQVPELLVEDSECAANEECALNALQRHALQKKAPVAKMYGQCGGAKWKGPTTCEDGGKCVMTNEWYAQCEPEAAAEVPAPSPGAVEAKDEKQEQPPPEKTMGPLPSRPKQPAPKIYETLNPIVARGNFLYDSVTGDRFFAKGVAYNPRNEKYDHSFGPSVHVAGWVDKCVPGDPKGGYWGYTADVVSDEKEEFWTEDLEAMANMGANTIRLYNLDPRLSHAKFMKKAASLGIYAIVPLTGKDYGFLPAFPAPECYTKDLEDYGNVGVNLLGFAKTLMKEFSQYNNTLMFTAANELAQLDKNGYSAFPCVKAFVRDLHNYQADCAEDMRKVPLIYSDVDTGGGIARKVVADYLTCALESEADAVDAYGLNVYSWCDETYPGDGKADNFQYSPYKDIKQDFEDFSVPFIFSEFGCNLGVFKTKCPYPGGRTWPDVKHFLGEDMGQFMSGAVAFQWSMDKEEYGLTLSPGFLAGQDKLYLLDNYFQLQKQYKKYQVNGTWNAPASEVDKCSFVPSDVAPMEYTHKRPACPSKAMWTKVQHEKRVDTVVDWDVLPPPAISPIGNATLNISATAGLRAVPEAKADAVLRTVRSTLKDSGYQFQDSWADIIKGKEEAALAWIAANYLRGSFDVDSDVPSMGVIEMGGGSTQVTFEVGLDEFERVAEVDRFQFKTGMGRVYSLYAHSYLGFGQDYAQSKLQDTMGSSQSSDPCYPVGYERVKSGIRQTGSGDSTQCRTNIRSLLFQETTAPGRYEHELPVRGRFAATENFYYVRNDLKLPNKEGVCPTEAEAKEVCGLSLTDSAADRACFALSYQLAFLGALGAVDVPGIEVEVQRKINGGDIDWALGAALAHMLSSRVETETQGISMTMSVALTLVVALALLAAAFSMVCRPTGMAKGYDSTPTLFGSKSTGLE